MQSTKSSRDTATYGRAPEGSLACYLSIPGDQALRRYATQVDALARLYLDHRFDLLGSGWTRVEHGITCRGIGGRSYPPSGFRVRDGYDPWLIERLNPANRPFAAEIWRIVDPGYVPIDWQLDFISGYRWCDRVNHDDLFRTSPAIDRTIGPDPKVPWELSRMQHLPQLAYAYCLSQGGHMGMSPPQLYSKEFRNQVLDFVASNPPGYGINWLYSMDVGIRVANWLISYDLLRTAGAKFDEEFVTVFSNSVYDHGLFIIEHLEYASRNINNHFLANLCGLLYAAAYLPETPETDAWLAFAVHQLVVEMERQFHPDGTNFEASTCYHALSSEMMLFATLLVLLLTEDRRRALCRYDHTQHRVEPPLPPAPLPFHAIQHLAQKTPFPARYWERLERAAEFLRDVAKPDLRTPQVGDHDSGRFVKLSPVYQRTTAGQARDRYHNLEGYEGLPGCEDYWDEEFLDHRALVGGLGALLGRQDLVSFSGSCGLEADMISTLLQPGWREDCRSGSHAQLSLEESFGSMRAWNTDGPDRRRRPKYVNRFQLDGRFESETFDVRLFAYPDFGLYVVQGDRSYLAVRCGSIGQRGRGGHAHNDQLSLELSVDGEDVVMDPGSYVYSSIHQERDRYRSAEVHFAPHLSNEEPSGLGKMFALETDPQARCLYFGHLGFVGCYHQGAITVCRRIEFKRPLIVVDWIEGSPEDLQGVSLCSGLRQRVRYSPGYGKLYRNAYSCPQTLNGVRS